MDLSCIIRFSPQSYFAPQMFLFAVAWWMGILPKVQAWDTATTEGPRTASFSNQPQEIVASVTTSQTPNMLLMPVGFASLGMSENRGLVLAGHWGTFNPLSHSISACI